MSETVNKGGRPRVDATAITLRLPPPLLSRLDEWLGSQSDVPGRPEAIRRLLDLALRPTRRGGAASGNG